MSQTKAHPEHMSSSEKKAIAEADQHTVEGVAANPIPAPEDGGHAKSHAAHLHEAGDVHSKPAGNLRQGSGPGELREPPQQVSRVGKDHRGQ